MTTTLFNKIQYGITLIGCPLCVLIGNVGGGIGLFVFLQKSMRQNPCGLILIAYIITNILYIDFTIVLAILNGLFQINPSIQSSMLCHLQYYVSLVFAVIPSYLLVLASIDRSFASSRNVHTRLKSTRRFAGLMIGLICLFWTIFHLHAFFTTDIQVINGEQLICTFLQGISIAFVSYYNLLCVGILPVLLMIVFGIRILMNVNRSDIQRNHSHSNRRLILVLSIQIGTYFCLRLPVSLYLIYQQITKLTKKSSSQIALEQFLQSIIFFGQFIQVSICPLLNFTTKSFRMEFKRALNKMTRKFSRSQSVEPIPLEAFARRVK